jgi:hypothetical protein
MTITRHPAPRLAVLAAALGAAALLSACVVEAPPRYVRPAPVYQQPATVYQQPAPVYEQPEPVYEQPAPDYAPDYAPDSDPVVSVYVDPPIDQPEPIAVQWAPPPMLVEVPPPQPYPDAVWTGGYWSWEGRWFWAAGRWSPPPRPHYVWVQPYYEHRADVVVFVPGFWCAPERHFVPPAPGLHISVALAGPGIRAGRRPMGPQGVFVPPPPGSRAGIIVPAPLGTPPAVVVSAPPVVNVGMRVRGNVDVNDRNIRNVSNVTVEAPAAATANGQSFHNSVPARAHLAAELAAAGRPAAPRPVSQQAIPTYQPGRAPVALPAGQPLRNERNERNDRWQNGARAGSPPQPATQQQPMQAPAPQSRAQPPAPRFGQGRPEFDQPPRTPAPVNGQPQPQGQAQAPQGQGQQPAWQRGQQHGQPSAWQQRAGIGQPPQGQAPVQPQQWTPQSGQPAPVNPQDQRRRGGNPQGQAPAAQPAPQAAAPAQQPPQARGREGKESQDANERDDRKKTPHERPEDREKRNGERER